MKKKDLIGTIIVGIIAVALMVIGLLGGFNLSEVQKDALKTVSIVAACAALYCFVVGEIARNNSQMDKLWSILPIAYMWIVAAKSGLNPRVVIMAVVATLWGVRLTANFAAKGAYSWRFWAGEEDYRWEILRNKKPLNNKFVWALFDLFFISIIQNFVVLAITFPAIAVMESKVPFGIMDTVATDLMVGALLVELVADIQQWNFYQKRKKLMEGGKKLSEIAFPFCRGFNTSGLWSISRHPNYFGEQLIWISAFLFTFGAEVPGLLGINWSVIGCAFLVLIFLGSSTMGESISSSKYPEYTKYQEQVSKIIPIPWKKYKG